MLAVELLVNRLSIYNESGVRVTYWFVANNKHGFNFQLLIKTTSRLTIPGFVNLNRTRIRNPYDK